MRIGTKPVLHCLHIFMSVDVYCSHGSVTGVAGGMGDDDATEQQGDGLGGGVDVEEKRGGEVGGVEVGRVEDGGDVVDGEVEDGGGLG